MPNKVIGVALRFLFQAVETCRQAAADSINYANVAVLDSPFDIHHSVEFRNAHQIEIQKLCTIKARTILNGRSSIRPRGISFGPDTYLKENCYFDAYGGFIEVEGQCAFAQNTIVHGGGGVTIGSNLITGANCYIIASNHKFESREYPIMLQGDRRVGIKIGRNVWLGGQVVVLDGVEIGDNCVIGAGTVVTRSVPSDTLLFDRRNRQEKGLYAHGSGH
jgi:acetyltransferase-like isoleucine patch superfamily enzyme